MAQRTTIPVSSPGAFIDNYWLPGQGAPLHSLNPALPRDTDPILWQGRCADAKQVAAAVDAARAAFDHWAECRLDERIRYLRSFTEQLEQQQQALALLLAEESGKPVWESRTEITAMIGKLDISIKAQQERAGSRSTSQGNGQAVLQHKPHGVVAVFGPFNFPGHLPNGHIMPALLAGNTVIFKPSEQTPRFAEKMVELWQQTDLPPGVLNLLQGERETAVALAGHPGLDGLYFTGSAATGRLLHQQLAGQPEKILALEMGGNNALIIEDYSELQAAVHDTLQSAYITAGQRCTCARRLLLIDNAEGDRLLQALIKATRQLQVKAPVLDGSGTAEGFMGSMISAAAAQQIIDAQHKLQQLGAEIRVEARLLQPGTGLISPGLIDVSRVSELPDDEYFGPLLQVIRYQRLDDAIRLANNTRYGLSAALFSEHIDKYQQFHRQIRAGIVNWNRQTTGASSAAPFGGIGISGNHRPSAYYAADYCAYPVAGLEADYLQLPETLLPGLDLSDLNEQGS